MSGNNGSHPDYSGGSMPEHLGTFPVAVGLHVMNLEKFIKNMKQAVDEDNDGTLLMYFNRNDIQLADHKGVIRITLTLD
jgi:hypothetical protein|tara:strand:- start:462 stop:698 length:237 start_codon:yes stop_codon:yes gene_type:complete